MAEGAGAYSAGIIATLIVLFMLWPMRYVGRVMNPIQVHVLDVELKKDQRPAMVVEALEQLGAARSGRSGRARTTDRSGFQLSCRGGYRAARVREAISLSLSWLDLRD